MNLDKGHGGLVIYFTEFYTIKGHEKVMVFYNFKLSHDRSKINVWHIIFYTVSINEIYYFQIIII